MAPIPIAASVRHDITRLDGHHLSADAVERIVTRAMAGARVPALAVAIINRGEIVSRASHGASRGFVLADEVDGIRALIARLV
jgi:CubicO group peptidase (beta-lactamase class C family)